LNDDQSVLVVGGGIAGIQASLDLAEQGYKVHLVERQASIGGKMALLDKTFPTMDCAVCIFSPKMIEVSRHPNVNILTYSEVDEILGKAGNFNVKVLRKARYVDEEICNGCDDCTAVCTVNLPVEYEMGIGQRKAIYRMFPQAVPNIFTIDKRGLAPCRDTCPAGMNVQGYVALIRDGKFKEALELMRADQPFPSVCGRVCFHPCELDCERKNLDEPIAIRSLKRFATDYEKKYGADPVEPVELTHEQRIAIIGSGPAGLTAAHDLIKNGYPVTIYESMPKPGGMLMYGIPSYRLPKDILDQEIKRITDLGVEIKTGVTFGKDVTQESLTEEGYKAILMAIGAWESRTLQMEGENLPGVIQALDLLKDLNLGKKPKLSGKVAIVGGGNVAIDAARSSLRLGAEEVTILYRRSRTEMPAFEEDIVRAVHEGIKLELLVNPTRFIEGDRKVKAVECIRMELGEPDESGRRRPVPIPGSEFTLDVDTAILAIGQIIDRESVPKDLDVNRNNTIIADKLTKETNKPNVFACGDIVLGPASVIEAIAGGQEAAESIHRYIQEMDLKEGRNYPVVKAKDIPLDGFKVAARAQMPELDPYKSLENFNETELGFTEEQAILEAQRCLSCGGCSECHECEKVCDKGAINHDFTDEILELNVDSIILATGLEPMDPSPIKEYGYGRFKNVISALELERMITATGCTTGELLRPSDMKHPHHITFIQCVGSRTFTDGYPYCSSVCCMHATKEAMLAIDHAPGTEVTIFYTDIRAFGKDFRDFVNRAMDEYGVKYVRAKPSEIREDPDSKSLSFWYEDTITGEITEMKTDLLVLSSALAPTEANTELAVTLGVEVDEYGFFVSSDPIVSPLSTTKEGIYMCGYSQGPKDIPDTIAEASGAAAMVGSISINGEEARK
jgi:heterodisulfide reductase subunit A-like polyferredoxin